MTPAVVVTELTGRFHRARVQHAAAGRIGSMRVFDRLLWWLATNGEELARPL